MRKLIVSLLAVFLIVLNAAAQDRTISGVVTNEKNLPMAGVSISTPDGKNGTQTDNEGKYSLRVPASARTLSFSFVNYQTVSLTIGRALNLDVSLKPTDSRMEEVVIIGYGTQKRKEATGSIASVKGAVVADKPVQSFEQALAGRAAGVQITVPNGVLNAPPVFRIRGTNSISLSSYP